jgi:hypothetical protein
MFVRRFQEPAQPVARRTSRGGTTGAGHDAAQAAPYLGSRRQDRGAELLRLQRAYGNRHVQGMVEQSKLKVSLPSDRSERDADRVARALPGGAMPPRREASGLPGLDAGAERAIRHARGGGQPLAGSVREPMEQHLGADLAEVRLHTDTRADQLSRSVQALAFTAGNDIFFRRGGYAPGSPTGRYLLAHELTHVTQQQSGTDQPAVQRYIASVNHGLRDPKAEPKDDYGTYRSLDVALKAGGGNVYKGPNQPAKGGVLDQLSKDPQGIKLDETEDLYLVGHGKQNLIGMVSPKVVAEAVTKITPDGWKGRIFSLNCWSAYRVNDTPSAVQKLHEMLAEKGRKNISVSGPVGRSIRHQDWLGEEDSPLGMKAVVADLHEGEKGEEEKVYNELLSGAQQDAEIKGKVEDAFDKALREQLGTGNIGVEEKAKFATNWGRDFQTNLVKRLETDERLKGAIGKRLFFGRSGLYETIASRAHELSPGEEQVVVPDQPKGIPPVPQPGKAPEASRARSWTWLSIAGLGLVGVAALGAGIWLIKRK